MNEFEDLEKDLRNLSPKTPTVHFSSRIEEALGDSGGMAFRRVSEEQAPKSQSSKLLPFALTLGAGLGIAAIWVMLSSFNLDLKDLGMASFIFKSSVFLSFGLKKK